jgi:hypothetical protein
MESLACTQANFFLQVGDTTTGYRYDEDKNFFTSS